MDLESRLEEILSESPARIGVALRHIESGTEVMIDADRPVPLASVVKVPILVEAFHQIAAQRIRLDDRWALSHQFKTVGSGVLSVLDDGLALSVRDILTLMIVISDNTATDMVIERLGADQIQVYMRQLGLNSIFVRHTIREIFDDMLPSGAPDQNRAELARWIATAGVRRDGFAYSSGADNNVGTPRDLVRLMEMIAQGTVVDSSSCQAMLDILLKQQLNERFPRYLPAGTRVAHKTGSFAGVRNDVGILYIDDNSRVAFAVLSTWDHDAVRGDQKAEADVITELDQTFGMIGLAVYETFATHDTGANL
jgi:beta-lactamase class A